MVAGMDRYYQVARCYRDEASKPDRQPEFTQLDIEMSFIDENDCMEMIESLLKSSWPLKPKLVTPFYRMRFEDAMKLYGCDKPDLRFDMLFSEVTSLLRERDSNVSKLDSIKDAPNFKAYAFKIDSSTGIDTALTFKNIEKEFQQLCKNAFANNPNKFEKENLVFTAFKDGSGTNISKYMNNATKSVLLECLKAKSDDTIVLLAWEKNEPKLLEILGKLRLTLADLIDSNNLANDKNSKLLRDPKVFKFLWVIDFPLFSRNEETNQLESTHHPFTAPIKEHEHLVKDMKNLDSVIGLHYDLVLNGEEVAGGSIRIHDSKFQRHVLENVLKEDTQPLEHLLEAFEYGAPPHGGIALGLDRLTALMAGTENIRNVIAFPKAQSGRDIMSNAPAPVPQSELDYYGIKCFKN
jgi:aspartyl-tRNA synthetase